MLADRFAGQPGLHVGEGRVKNQPEALPGTNAPLGQRRQQFTNGREIADEADRRPRGKEQPQAMFDRLQEQLARAGGALVELQPGQMVAFDLRFDPHEEAGVHRLRAGKTAEQPTGEGGYQEEPGGGHGDGPEGRVEAGLCDERSWVHEGFSRVCQSAITA